LDMCKTYRVFFNIISNIEVLDYDVQADLLKRRDLLESLITIFNPLESANVDFTKIENKQLKYILLNKPRRGHINETVNLKIFPGVVKFQE